MAGDQKEVPARDRTADGVRRRHPSRRDGPRVMTQALVRAGAAFVAPPPPVDDSSLLIGTVIQVGPPIQVNVDGMKLACTSLVGVAAADSVYLLRKGRTAVIIGKTTGPAAGTMVAFVAGTANNLAYNNNAGAMVVVLTLPSTTFVSGRRYFVEWTWRAATTPTYLALFRDGVAAGPDFYHDYPNAGVISYMGGTGSFYWTDSGAHTMTIAVRGQGANAG